MYVSAPYTSRVWLGIHPNLAVDVLHGPSFIDRFICKIFTSERELVPNHSGPVAISVSSKHSKSSNSTSAIGNTSTGENHKTDIEVVETSTPICMACQASLEPLTKFRLIVTASAFSSHTIEPRILEGTCQLTLAAYVMIDVLLLQPFRILISNFCEKEMHLPKYMVAVYATGPPTSVMTASSLLHQRYLMKTPECL